LILYADVVAHAAACTSPARPRWNVVLITVDTLRADHIGLYGSDRGLTPSIDRLGANADVYTTAYTPAPFTLGSIGALMTGRYPSELRIDSNASIVPAGVPTLAALLRARGWRTGAVVSSFVLRREAGLDQGFDYYDDRCPGREAHRPIPERTAPATAAAALRMLHGLSLDPAAPFFLWVHFQDPHGPYTPPATLRARSLPAERRAPDAARTLPVSRDDRGLAAIPRYQFDGHREPAWYRAGYDGEVRYMDDNLTRLLATIDRPRFAHRTVVIFAADHGEGLGEDDYWFEHGEYLSDELVRVPLVIRVPDRVGIRHAEPASLLAVLPTITRLLGLPAGDTVRERNLLASGMSTVYLATRGEASMPRVGIVTEGYKYVVSSESGAMHEALFDLRSHETDVIRTQPAATTAMRTALAAFESRLEMAAPQHAADPAAREKLRALGYTGG